MRTVVCGLGNQGQKRILAAGEDVVATVDPVISSATYTNVEALGAVDYDAVLVCTPDHIKLELIDYFLSNAKHILVEKPLYSSNLGVIDSLFAKAATSGVCLYTAYNHRFEPHIQTAQAILSEKTLGKIYNVRLYYGNGTAQNVRESEWRDKGLGVLGDLGCHLLDIVLYLLGPDVMKRSFHPYQIVRHENSSPDHCIIGAQIVENKPSINLEMSLLSWKNTFTLEIICEKGSLSIESLCKWGPSKLTVRHRKFPSGRPDENEETVISKDPTWQLEYNHFKELCRTVICDDTRDYWINQTMINLAPNLISEHTGEG